ncbi:ABC transporter ATP-binding protein [Halopenitus sp. H-Gu1]|uniref:ABC transporter ATP-binding protein n=1 Tax=Halopenitus sp. H-Gu1 TaxID=3242697 RepID=UPI00359E7282
MTVQTDGSLELRIENLDKHFGETLALRNVDLTLDTGVTGLLGSNGAGKSTLMRIVTGVIDPTEGTVYWNGTDVTDKPQVIRQDVGYLPQDFGVYPNLTAREFLSYLAAIRGLNNPDDRITDLLELVNLSDVHEKRLGDFSGGMRQRVGIAQALLSDPDLLIVDEPTVGLDPTERVRFRNVLADLADERVVVLSTHIVPDVEATANDVAVLHNGHLRAHTSPSELIARATGTVWEWTAPSADLAALRREYTVSSTSHGQDGVRVRIIADTQPTSEATSVEPTLEDAYLALLAEDRSS